MRDAQGYFRLWDIIGCRKRGIQGIVPVSRSNWFSGVKSGRFPKPVKLSERTTAWRVTDIQNLIEQLNKKGGQHVGV